MAEQEPQDNQQSNRAAPKAESISRGKEACFGRDGPSWFAGRGIAATGRGFARLPRFGGRTGYQDIELLVALAQSFRPDAELPAPVRATLWGRGTAFCPTSPEGGSLKKFAHELRLTISAPTSAVT